MQENVDHVENIQSATTETLEIWRLEIDKEINSRSEKEQIEAKRRIREIAEKHGIDLAEMATQKQVNAKYRNPENQFETWTGRGQRPKWVKEWLAKNGDNLELLLKIS